MHDPTTLDRQKNDIGTQYRSAIFYHNDAQKKAAENVINKVQAEVYEKEGKSIVTALEKFGTFWMAEEYHQQYLEKAGKSAKKGDGRSGACA